MNQTLKSIDGLHPQLLSSMQGKSGKLTDVQHQMLHQATTTGADLIVETTEGCGRYLAMCAYASHFAFAGKPQNDIGATVIIITRPGEASGHCLSTANWLGVGRNYFTRVDTLESYNKKAPMVFVGNIDSCTGGNRVHDSPAKYENCRALIIEDASNPDLADRYVQLIEQVVEMSPQVNLCLLSLKPPSQVDMSLRYLLRRSCRCYIPAQSPTPLCTTLLCTNADDRAELCLRLAEMEGARRVLILTHNRDVKELRSYINDQIGLRAYAIQRSTPAKDRDVVLSEFLSRQYAVLVAMDAYTGLDLMDVDAVIQYYPPQKSMSEEEWTEYITCLSTTGNAAQPCYITTIAAPDDLSIVKYVHQKLPFAAGPVLNLSPTHVQFADLVRNPWLAVLAKGPTDQLVAAKEEQAARAAVMQQAAANAAAAAAEHDNEEGLDDDEDDDHNNGGGGGGRRQRRRRRGGQRR